jgi:hypothetical protein
MLSKLNMSRKVICSVRRPVLIPRRRHAETSPMAGRGSLIEGQDQRMQPAKERTLASSSSSSLTLLLRPRNISYSRHRTAELVASKVPGGGPTLGSTTCLPATAVGGCGVRSIDRVHGRVSRAVSRGVQRAVGRNIAAVCWGTIGRAVSCAAVRWGAISGAVSCSIGGSVRPLSTSSTTENRARGPTCMLGKCCRCCCTRLCRVLAYTVTHRVVRSHGAFALDNPRVATYLRCTWWARRQSRSHSS